jgi:hypothetical protein
MALADAGLAVMPVELYRDGERWRKVPCIKNWEAGATTDPTRIARWWGHWPLAVPGVPLGRCGRVVVDCDRHGGVDGVAAFAELGPFPPHPVNQTKSNGAHHWFTQPAEPIRWVKWEGGEVLGVGRFVVGYAVPVGPMPVLPEVFWKGLATTHMRVTQKSETNIEFGSSVTPMLCVATAHQINYAKRALGNACYELRQCSEGRRNNLLNVLAYKMGRLIVCGWISRERVEDYLLKACEANGLVDDDGAAQCKATIASGISSGMKRPYHEVAYG